MCVCVCVCKNVPESQGKQGEHDKIQHSGDRATEEALFDANRTSLLQLSVVAAWSLCVHACVRACACV